MKLLKQVWSGELYVWTPELAERKDMVPYERETPPAPEPVVDAPAAEEVVEPAPKRTRSSFKKALAAKAAELTHGDQVSGA